MSKKKLLSFLSAALASAMLFSGCSAPAASGGAVSSAGGGASSGDGTLAGKSITVVLKSLTVPFFISVQKGAEAAGEEYGVKVNVLAPLKMDNPEEQSQIVEQTIANRPDVIVLCPIDSNGIVPVVKELNAANIPIVNLNTKINGTDVKWETFVAIENYQAGYDAAKALAETMGGSGELIILEGPTGSQASLDRVQGALDAFQETGVEVVARQAADNDRAKGMNVSQNLLQAHPKVKGIFCCNDEMALGTVEAIDAAKMSGIQVSGIDANEDALQAIREGKMAVTVDSQPYVQGYSAVEAAVKLLKGEKVDEKIVTPVQVITKENVGDVSSAASSK